MADVVLVIDMLRGFLEEGRNLYCGPGARRIIDPVRRLLEREVRRGSRVIFIHDTHRPDDLEFQLFPRHCVEGTPETEVIAELADVTGDHLPKNRYSAFFGTDLEQRLRALRAGKLIVCGVCTDICVLHTVADARNRDYAVEVPSDCVASFDEDAHRWALLHMEKVLGARVVSAAG